MKDELVKSFVINPQTDIHLVKPAVKWNALKHVFLHPGNDLKPMV